MREGGGGGTAADKLIQFNFTFSGIAPISQKTLREKIVKKSYYLENRYS